MLDWIYQPEAWVALVTLTGLEIVLGIDNIIFISILVSRLPQHQREQARMIGLGLAMVMRLLLLASLAFIMSLINPLFELLGQEISGRDLLMIIGGFFLLGKSAHEIHHALERDEVDHSHDATATLLPVLVQIAVLDIVFSLDSVISAVGLVDNLAVMMIAIIISVILMMLVAKPIGDFVDRHPSVRMLALSFMVMIGVLLMAEGFDYHIPKGYIYFSMFFALLVEFLNIWHKQKSPPVKLRKAIEE